MQKLKNIGNYFGATPDRPFHLSVSGIILDSENNVICLHYPKLDQYANVYTLMNKTVRPNETLEAAFTRGAESELGTKINIITFLGTNVVNDTWWGELGTPLPIEKSIVFFLGKAIFTDEKIATTGEIEPEGKFIVHKSFNFLIDTMQQQSLKDGMRDFNQSNMLIRAKEWIESHPDLVSATLD